MTIQTQTPKGKHLARVKFQTKCPDCGATIPEGYQAAWWIRASESKTGKAQVFCDRRHATNYYGAPALPEPERVNTPIALVEECGAQHDGFVCTLDKGHTAPAHEAHRTDGTIAHIWEDGQPSAAEEIISTREVVGALLTPGVITVNGVEISTVGKHAKFELCVRVAAATGPDGQKCNLLLVGPAGTGKSTLAKQVHEALGLIFGQAERDWCSLSLASDTPSSKLFGYKDANGVFQRTPFHGTYTGGGTDLIDELDNGSDTVVAGLNQAIANGEAAFAEGNELEHEYHRLIATANTFGKGGDRIYVARKQLDGASLDRFVTVELGYDEALEYELAHRAGLGAPKAAINDLIATVRQARDRAAAKKLPLIFSPRACIDGALLLASGIDLETVLEIRVFAGVSSDVRAGLQ